MKVRVINILALYMATYCCSVFLLDSFLCNKPQSFLQFFKAHGTNVEETPVEHTSKW